MGHLYYTRPALDNSFCIFTFLSVATTYFLISDLIVLQLPLWWSYHFSKSTLWCPWISFRFMSPPPPSDRQYSVNTTQGDTIHLNQYCLPSVNIVSSCKVTGTIVVGYFSHGTYHKIWQATFNSCCKASILRQACPWMANQKLKDDIYLQCKS